MKVILNNGTELEVIVVNGSSKQFQGANRDSLEFQFAKAIPQTFEELNTLFSNQNNTNKITLTSDTASYIHDNYSLKVSMGLIPVTLAIATDTTPEITEERYSIIMAQKSYKEIELENLNKQLATTQEAVDFILMGGM